MSKVSIETDDLKALFDLVAQSMDFGSGFLDGEDVVLLRKIAEMIGVDPIAGTPSTHASQYPHVFQGPGSQFDLRCSHCVRPEDDPIHVAPATA